MDVIGHIAKFDIAESINKPYTSLRMTLLDSTGILNRFGLNGGNMFSISFAQPGMNPYNGTFLLTSVEENENLENQRIAVYECVGYSPHVVKFPEKIQKSYKDIPLTDVARDLIGMLGATKPLRIDAPARGIAGNTRMPYTINGIPIPKGVLAALRRAASTTDQSSAYVWFENQFNQVISTLEYLVQHMSGGPHYFQRPMGTDFLADVRDQNFNILQFKEESRVDKTEQFQGLSQSTRPFDFFGNLFQNIDKQFGGGTGKSGFYHNIPYNSMRPPTFLQNVLPARKWAASTFDSQSITCVTAFNSYLTVGRGVFIETLAPPGDTNILQAGGFCRGDRISNDGAKITPDGTEFRACSPGRASRPGFPARRRVAAFFGGPIRALCRLPQSAGSVRSARATAGLCETSVASLVS